MLEPIGLLRAVYAERLADGRANTEALSARLALDPSETGRELKRLEERGLVTSESGDVRLTERGRSQLRVVMIGGAFEVIHPGHLHTLSEARRLGNTLVVVVATDESVRRNKRREPATDQEWRMRLVGEMRSVDIVVAGGRGSIYDTLEKVRPDVVALGYDQHHDPGEIVREAERRGISLSVTRLDSPLPGVKTSKFLGASL